MRWEGNRNERWIPGFSNSWQFIRSRSQPPLKNKTQAVNKHVSLHESTVLELSTSHTEELETVKNEYEETIGDLEARLSAVSEHRE